MKNECRLWRAIRWIAFIAMTAFLGVGQSPPSCGPVPIVGPEICDDGWDNDGDGLVDCADRDCDLLACNDHDPCNVGEVCHAGVCDGGAPADCAGTAGQCRADATCDPAGAEGNCDIPGDPTNQGLRCDDGDVCNVGEICDAGVCIGGAPVDCSGTGDRCTMDSTCDPTGREGNCDVPGDPYPEECDGVDNDCDGATDEDLGTTPTSCGVGACEATGELVCRRGQWYDTCTPTPSSREDCNRIDDDCDGATDEGIDPIPTTCGVGACAATGEITCVDGVPADSCTPGSPGVESCDDADNDCDGATDEDLGSTPTTCGVGACSATGEIVCDSGWWVDTCDPGPPALEDCNGVDDDCDGATDEDPGLCLTPCGVGTRACAAGVWDDACVPPATTPEVCDGLDNDCDGMLDEGQSCGPDESLICGTDGCGDWRIVPDTGQTECADDGATIPCPAPGESLYGQDANHTGPAHSFSVLDPYATGETVVADGVTGLTWTQAIAPDTYGHASAEHYCLSLTYAGLDDWRLPRVDELITIVDHSRVQPAIYIDVFPDPAGLQLWAAERLAAGGEAWYVETNYGSALTGPLTTECAVRCVRGGAPFKVFDLAPDASIGPHVVDRLTGLTWQMNTRTTMLPWAFAVDYCDNLVYGGHTDWRLPNRLEMASLIDLSRYDPALPPELAAGVDADTWYWTSTTEAGSRPYRAWRVEAVDGRTTTLGKEWSLRVRCVRDSGPPEPDCDCYLYAPCCDGCHFLDATTVCEEDVATEIGCSSTVGCRGNVVQRTRDRLCPGDASTCTGALGDWKDWVGAETCDPVTEACNPVAGTCVPDASCQWHRAYVWSSLDLSVYNVSNPDRFVGMGTSSWPSSQPRTVWPDPAAPAVIYTVSSHSGQTGLFFDAWNTTDPNGVSQAGSTQLLDPLGEPTQDVIAVAGRVWARVSLGGPNQPPHMVTAYDSQGAAPPVAAESFEVPTWSAWLWARVVGDHIVFKMGDDLRLYRTTGGTEMTLVAQHQICPGQPEPPWTSAYHAAQANGHAIVLWEQNDTELGFAAVSLATGDLAYCGFTPGQLPTESSTPNSVLWSAGNSVLLGSRFGYPYFETVGISIDFSIPSAPVVHPMEIDGLGLLPFVVDVPNSRAMVIRYNPSSIYNQTVAAFDLPDFWRVGGWLTGANQIDWCVYCNPPGQSFIVRP